MKRSALGQRGWNGALALVAVVVAFSGCEATRQRNLEVARRVKMARQIRSKVEASASEYYAKLTAPTHAQAQGMRSFRVVRVSDAEVTASPESSSRYSVARTFWLEGIALHGKEVALRRTVTLAAQVIGDGEGAAAAVTSHILDDKLIGGEGKSLASQSTGEVGKRFFQWLGLVLLAPLLGMLAIYAFSWSYKSCLWWMSFVIVLGIMIVADKLGRDDALGEALVLGLGAWFVLCLWSFGRFRRFLAILLYLGYGGACSYYLFPSTWWAPMILFVPFAFLLSALGAAIQEQRGEA